MLIKKFLLMMFIAASPVMAFAQSVTVSSSSMTMSTSSCIYDHIANGIADFHCAGSMQGPVNFPGSEGHYQISILARGDLVPGKGFPNAQISIDGVAVGNISVTSSTFSTYTLNNISSNFILNNISKSPGSHVLNIAYTNDYYGGPTADQNLYIQNITISPSMSGCIYDTIVNGIANFRCIGSMQGSMNFPGPGGPYQITMLARGDLVQVVPPIFPNAQVSIDGVVVGSIPVKSSSFSTYTLNNISVSPGSHTLKIAYTNDYYGGSTATDQNLYIQSVVISPGVTVSLPGIGINWAELHQKIDGFGASGAFLNPKLTQAQIDMFFSQSTGIGLSLYRNRIAPPGAADGAPATSLNGTAPELSLMLAAQKLGARVWSTPWTPPAAWKDNGSVNGAIEGPYQISISARGDLISGEFPNAQISIDGVVVGNISVKSSSFSTYTLNNIYTSSAGGNRTLKIAYTNDANGPVGDQNLYIQNIVISGASANVTESPASLTMNVGSCIYDTIVNGIANFRCVGSAQGSITFPSAPLVLGHLIPAYYPYYANYLANYVSSMKAAGVNLYGVSIQNEPGYPASYEGCLWSAQNLHDLVPLLYKALNPNGVVGSTKIIMPESGTWDGFAGTIAPTLNDKGTPTTPGTASEVGIYATHDYGYHAYPPPDTGGTPVWETETSTFEGFDGSMTNGLYWAQRIHDGLTVGNVSAWHYWWLGGTQDNEGLSDSNFTPAKRMYVLGNYSKFIRPGFNRIGVTNTGNLLVTAYRNTSTGSFVIVAVNPGNAAVNQQFSFNGFKSAQVIPWITSASLSLAPQVAPPMNSPSTFTYSIPAQSVVTFVGQGQ